MFLPESKAILWSRGRSVFQRRDAPCRSFRRIICKYGNFTFCYASLTADTTITPRRKTDGLIQPHWVIWVDLTNARDFVQKIRQRFISRTGSFAIFIACKKSLINVHLIFAIYFAFNEEQSIEIPSLKSLWEIACFARPRYKRHVLWYCIFQKFDPIAQTCWR